MTPVVVVVPAQPSQLGPLRLAQLSGDCRIRRLGRRGRPTIDTRVASWEAVRQEPRTRQQTSLVNSILLKPAAASVEVRAFQINSSGFGGQDACLVLATTGG